MAEAERPAPDELARQARRHLESLKAAGVDWLPVAPPPCAAPVAAAASAPAQPPTAAAPSTPTGAVPLPVVQPGLWSPAAGPSLAEAAADGREQRLQLLADLAEKVSQCTRCPALASTRSKTVFGVGSLDPEVCFVGEAPGFEEDRTGEPFVGPAGQLLDRIIVACGWKREEVYICNVLRCRPPGNRTPLPDESENCREWLEGTLQLVRPKYLCALGATAANNLLGMASSIGRLRGRFHDYRGIPVLCTYHPSYLLRNPAAKKDVWEDMKKLLAHMGRPVPSQKG